MRWRSSDSLPPLELAAGEVGTPARALLGEQQGWLIHGSAVLLTIFFFLLFARISDGDVINRTTPLTVILSIALVIPTHELLHALAHPAAGLSDATVMGFDRRMAAPYCLYTRPYSRNRAIVVAIAPLVFLTFLPVLVCTVGECGPLLAWIASLNAGASAFDLACARYAWKRLHPDQMIGLDVGKVTLVSSNITSPRPDSRRPEPRLVTVVPGEASHAEHGFARTPGCTSPHHNQE